MNAKQVVINDIEHILNDCETDFEKFGGNNFLITGGAGFLGFYLVQSLMRWNQNAEDNKKIHLTVMDNFMRGVPSWLDQLRDRKELKIIKHNVTDDLPESIPDFHYIIHAASIASPTYYRLHPIETMDANVQGLRILLDYSKNKKETRNPIKGFLFFSSSEIYGNPSPEHIPTNETYNGYVSCTGPRACYDESKRYGETLCVNFARKFDLPITMARPFNNYGPGLKITDKRVIPDFARNVLDGQDMVLLSDGSPTRTFCYVADAIAGYFKILSRGEKAEAYNIGVEEPEISMLELANHIANLGRDLFGYAGKVVHQTSDDKEYLIDNPDRRCPNIRKATEQIDYAPSTSIEEGLRRTMIWYNENNEGSAD